MFMIIFKLDCSSFYFIIRHMTLLIIVHLKVDNKIINLCNSIKDPIRRCISKTKKFLTSEYYRRFARPFGIIFLSLIYKN